jgi:hypothetical protein
LLSERFPFGYLPKPFINALMIYKFSFGQQARKN